MRSRSKQSRITVWDFGDSFLVVCPICSRRAMVSDRGAHPGYRIVLTCRECGHSDTWKYASPGIGYTNDLARYTPGQVCIGAAADWYFHLPLWLQVPCCGEMLWAYNADHLQFLEDYVGATLRERRRDEEFGWSNQSLASRLPTWMKSAKNRSTVLKCLAKLKAMLV